MKALSFIKEAESNAEKAKAAAMANIMKQKAEIDARNAEVEKNKVEPAAPKAPEYDVEEYKKLLSWHDWYYDYSDDHSVWQRGHGERQDLYRMQDAIDSDYKIWNQYAPDMYKRVKTAEGKSTLPPHLAKLFNPDGTCKDPEMQKRWEEIVRKNNAKKKLQSKWIDATPPGYGPADESCGSSHKKKKKVSEQDLDNELEYTGKLHPSIDFTSEHDDPSFCYDCKLVSTTHGEIDTEHDEADVVCPRCGSEAYVEASPEEIDKYASPESGMNEAEGQKPYVCVHAKKGKYECHADTTYGAAKQAAQHWKLKSTAGIDVHLADKEMAWSEGFASDAQRKAAFASGYDPKKKKKKSESIEESIHLQHELEPGIYKHVSRDIMISIQDDGSVEFIEPAEWEIEGDQEYLEYVQDMLDEPSVWTTDLDEAISEGTDLGQLGNGVLLNQFNMGKGVVGLQITSNKNTGYVHLDLDAAKDLQKKLDQWIGMRDKGELARPGDMDESIENLESLTEAQFDEAAGEKDACYHKVKSRYKVWPSAYASGALVQCRKVGAKNWGNKD